jgi:hypothetical protein
MILISKSLETIIAPNKLFLVRISLYLFSEKWVNLSNCGFLHVAEWNEEGQQTENWVDHD